MRKNILKCMVMLFVIMLLGVNTFALSEVRVRVNGAQVYFPDGKPYVDANNRVLVPVRFVSEQLGAKVDWNKEAKRVTIIEGDKEAILTIDSKQIMVNGTVKQLDTAAVLKGTRTYVPLRFVSEALGATVKWDNKVRIAYIDNGKAPLPEIKVFEAGPFTIPITPDCKVSGAGLTRMITTETLMKLSAFKDGSSIILVTQGMKVPYSMQCDEAEKLLTQIVSEAKAKEIMNFVRTKKDGGHKIGEKIYQTDNYEIRVDGNYESVNIGVIPE